MAFNGSGTFVRLYNWATDRSNGVKVRADRMDAEMDGFAAGLSNCMTRDGQSTVSADIPFNNKKITGLADATGATHAMNRQSSDARYVRNPNDLTPEATLSDADEFPFWDDSAAGPRSSTYANLRAKLGFPTGQKLISASSAAPTGWTRDATHNNKALRLVSGDVGSGGSTAFTSVFAARTLTRANLPDVAPTITITDPGHQHGTLYGSTAAVEGGTTATVRRSGSELSGSAVTGITATCQSLNGGVTQTALDFAVQYVDVNIIVKD